MCPLNVLDPMNCLPHERKKRSLLLYNKRLSKRTNEVPTARKCHPKNDRLIESTRCRFCLGSAWEIQSVTRMRSRESMHVQQCSPYSVEFGKRHVYFQLSRPRMTYSDRRLTHLASPMADPEGILREISHRWRSSAWEWELRGARCNVHSH
jgi:hypothetical protein